MHSTEDIMNTVKSGISEYALETFERAFPYFKDGLKPIHRRIIYMMYEEKITSFRKVALVVGTTMGRYHPHGDMAIYESLVRMAQPFALNYPYIDGQGNFGSQAGDGAAAARYIECKLSEFSKDVITQDIDQISIDYIDNYDYTRKLPIYLPTRLPLVLINGISGIAEAFIVDIPPHNMSDVVSMCVAYISDKNILNEDLVDEIYPDYPTGAEIINGEELQRLYKYGEKCSIKMHATMEMIREDNQIIIHDLPYEKDFDTIKTQVAIEITERNNVVLQGIQDMQENNKRKNNGRVTYDVYCKKDANLLEIINELYAKTNLSSGKSVSLMLNFGNKVKQITIKDIISYWYKARYEYKRRKYSYEISHNENKKHILEGFYKIYNRLDELIFIIKKFSGTKDELVQLLHKKFDFTIIQASNICGMSLSSISQTAKSDFHSKIDSLEKAIIELENNLKTIDNIIISELYEIEKKYKRERQTKITKDKKRKPTTKLSISQGSLLITRNSIGIFDANGIRESKTIVNGLRSVKIDGRNIKEIINAIPIYNDIRGIVLFYKDATVNYVSMKDIRVANTWYELVSDSNFILSATVVYSDTDEIITITKDLKIKRIKVEEIKSNRAINCGEPIIACATHETDPEAITVLMVDDKGEYCNLEIDEFPILGRTASGVKTNFQDSNKIYILPIYEETDENAILCSVTDTEDGQNYVITIPLTDIEVIKRINKFKRLPIPETYVCNTVELVNTKDRNSLIVNIGPSSSSTLKMRNYVKFYDFKRTFIPLVGSVQLY